MTKKELIGALHTKIQAHVFTLSLTEAEKILGLTFDLIRDAVKDGELSYPGFGKLKKVTRPARKARNPRTGEPVDVPEKTTVVFKAASGFFK